jgi:LytS/YehU family sensor histidine kinase
MAAIFLSFILFFYIILKVKEKIVLKRFEQEKKMTELELLTIKNQIDPHFIMNLMNSVASMVYKDKRKKDYDIFTKISRLLGYSLETSDQMSRSLEEEINFIRNYLELEKFRFKEKFNFDIHVDNNVDLNQMIPKMIIQNYVENSVKHGMRDIEKLGEILIDIGEKSNRTIITVEDNGIGRKKSKEKEYFTTGKGIEIMEKFYRLYGEINKVKIRTEILDLIDNEGNSLGTKVVIDIPNKSN